VLRKKIRYRSPNARIIETDDIKHLSKIIQRESPDIVFVDIAIYPKHALAHVRSIKQQLPSSVIVVLTTHDSAEHEAAANKYGVDYFISKTNPSSLPLIDKVLDTVS
jgi:DNA-binding NarL/FixJ family response regulator